MNGYIKKTGPVNNDVANGGREHKEHRTKRRKHRIVIHSSPFLRCIQTSIAISAGIGQHQDFSQAGRHLPISKSHAMHSGSPRLHSLDHGKTARLSAIVEPEDSPPKTPKKTPGRNNIRKPQLRVDAFLGEWLSPDYFDSITPPPSSVMMVAAAKADLLRPGEYMEIQRGITRTSSSSGVFPGGWGSGWSSPGQSASAGSDEDTPLSDLSSLERALPKRTQASSHNSAGLDNGGNGQNRSTDADSAVNFEQRGYIPPVPNYAISPSAMIPLGYVAHARDACLNVDYQWDSMRPPLDWGDGGEYGEEWSAMHKRFRRGLQNMILWYTMHDNRSDPSENSEPTIDPAIAGEDDDDDMDTVLILVTHGAGCNALIGALSSQPVLLDVGMASLTMAVRKDMKDGVTVSTPHENRRRSSIDLGTSESYDLRLIASIEHLRAGGSPSSVPQLQQSPRVGSQPISMYRHRVNSAASTTSTTSSMDNGFSLPEAATRATSGIGAAASLQRSPSLATSSAGLWSKPEAGAMIYKAERFENSPITKGAEDEKLMGNRGDENSRVKAKTAHSIDGNVALPMHSLPDRTNSQRGLWGASPEVVSDEREKGPKRRWTVNERS